VNTIEQLQLDIRAARNRIEAANQALEPKRRQLAELRSTLVQLEAKLASLQAEIGTPLVEKLNPTEQQELTNLTTSVTQLQKDHAGRQNTVAAS
jgi:chromosome segregation ATPase